jgi:peptidoglycan/xylan/chitin deacetylase (PgdA/CDA1 family)
VILGLRIDVCTYEGLRTGVPNLLALLARFEQRASFFVALGPDRSGRAVLQFFRPGFAAKMRRTRAIRAYGWRTVLSGTLLPARQAGDLAETVCAIPAAGHEVAVHGYDHRSWQDGLSRMAEAEIRREMAQAVAAYERVIGRGPQGFGAPGWQCNPASLRALDDMGFAYASDTRGRQPFFPSLDGRKRRTLQIPTTLPTLDEVLGVDGMDGEGFVRLVDRRLRQDPWPVLTLHAEMEGRRFLQVAETLLARWGTQGVRCLPLVEIATAIRTAGEDRIPVAEVVPRSIRGRAGSVATPQGLEPASEIAGADRQRAARLG